MRWVVTMLCLGACGSAAGRVGPAVDVDLVDMVDATGDVRLTHPPHPDIVAGTFDLERFSLRKDGDAWRVEATFAAPVATLTEVRAAKDRVVAMVPQTIDVYLDIVPEAGRLAALPGRGFRVPAGEAWDRVLVVSSVPDVSEPGVVHALRVTPQGRRLVATFPADAVDGEVRGILVVVLATSPSAEGRVRPVGKGGDCRVWNDERCRLEGAGPPVMDALGLAVGERPLALLYPGGERPKPAVTPVVFQRGSLLSVAPVSALEVGQGRLATVLDRGGSPIGTAIVLNVVGDTAALELLGPGAIEDASAVVFAAPGAL